MTSKLVVNTIESDTGISSVSFASSISMNSTAKFHFSAAGIDIGADTNINRPSAGVLGFNINSSEKARINSSGRLGLGTNNPDTTLTVQAGGDAQMSLKNSSGTTKAYVGTAGVFGSAGTDDLRIRSDSSNIIFGFSGSEKARITSNGKFGIGTVTPAALTHIYDSTNTSSATEQFRISGGNRTADTFETGFRFLTQSPSANGNRYVSFTSNGNTGLIIQTHETSTGNAAVDRVISLCPSGGSVNIGDNSTQTSRKLAVAGSVLFKNTEADIWMESTGPNGVWRILGSTGGSTHQFRIYDQSNAADRLIVDSNGRVVIGDTSTTNASTHADNLVISGSGNIGITIASTNSSDSNLFFSDGSSGSAPYSGYVQYNHGSNQLVFGANGALRSILYDKDGGTNHSVLLIGGGGTSNNHYNSINTASITFGGGNDIENYFLGVRRENYGGDYTKLDLRWHTGIRMGAQQMYGGIRFFNDEDLDSLKFSIMGGGDHVEAHTTFRPGANNTYNCGTSSRRWAQIWYYNANTTSDRNEKNTITESDLGLDFICKLKPVSYKWNQREGENADTKTHYGLISQDVEETVIESGKTLDDFGAIVKPEGDDPMGLSYNEFISPLVKAIQEQQEQIKILQEKIASLEGS